MKTPMAQRNKMLQNKMERSKYPESSVKYDETGHLTGMKVGETSQEVQALSPRTSRERGQKSSREQCRTISRSSSPRAVRLGESPPQRDSAPRQEPRL